MKTIATTPTKMSHPSLGNIAFPHVKNQTSGFRTIATLRKQLLRNSGKGRKQFVNIPSAIISDVAFYIEFHQ